MIFVIGGAFQGKSGYAEKLFGINADEWVDGENCNWSEIYHAHAIRHFHEFIKARLKEGEDIESLAEELIKRNPDAIIVSNEIGYGVVPMDPFERQYREAVGRICTKIAAASTEVHRVVCGLGTVIKHD